MLEHYTTQFAFSTGNSLYKWFNLNISY